MTKEEKAVLWAERIQEFRSSVQACKEWCTEHKISSSTMGYWIKAMKSELAVCKEYPWSRCKCSCL